MTLLRRLALRISTAVVKYASPGCKEWALGMLHETEFIESDLSAFTWALGSIRVLVIRREAPIHSLAEFSAMASEYVERKRTRTSYSSPIMMLIQAVGKLTFARDSGDRIGCAMVLLASLSLGISQLLERRRLDRLLSADLDEELLLYKKELQAAFRLSFRMGTVIFSFFVYMTGMFLTLHSYGSAAYRSFPWFLGLMVSMVVFAVIYRRSEDGRLLKNIEVFLSDNNPSGS